MVFSGYNGDGAPVGFGEAIRRGLWRSKFYGRASRSEFWYFWLLCVLLNIASAIVLGGILHLGLADLVFRSIVSMLQTVVFVRRLHDVGRSGWWVFLSLTIVGIVPLLVWSLRRGEPRRNRFNLARSGRRTNTGGIAAAIDRIEQLDRLRRDGAITEDEYRTLKQAAL